MYHIKKITNTADVEQGNIADINIYNWGGDYRPATTAHLCFIENSGFCVKLTCEETAPLAVVLPPVGQVCTDSCIEFFANFNPTVAGSPYINFEINALGAMCCEFAEKGGVRPRFEANGIPFPTVEMFKNDTHWGATLIIGFDTLKAVYGDDFTLKSGDIIRGNFFKCGDHTAVPHYGSFTEIKWDFPSFHQPQFFADMIIE